VRAGVVLAAHTWIAAVVCSLPVRDLHTHALSLLTCPVHTSLAPGSRAAVGVCVRAARARRLAAQALLLICWPGRLLVTVDSQKPHRSFSASHPLTKFSDTSVTVVTLSLSLAPSSSLFNTQSLISYNFYLFLFQTFSLSIYLSLLPSFSISLYRHSVHAYHLHNTLLNCADVRNTRHLDDRKSLLISKITAMAE